MLRQLVDQLPVKANLSLVTQLLAASCSTTVTTGHVEASGGWAAAASGQEPCPHNCHDKHLPLLSHPVLQQQADVQQWVASQSKFQIQAAGQHLPLAGQGNGLAGRLVHSRCYATTWSGQQHRQQQQERGMLLQHPQLSLWAQQQHWWLSQRVQLAGMSSAPNKSRSRHQQPHQHQQQQQGPNAPRGGPAPDRQQPKQRRNQQITAPQLMVVFPDGNSEVLPLSAALSAAEACGLDLVEVNPRADPPVARILDYGKFYYEQQQKNEAAEKQRRLQQKLATPKEMQFSARIADHDLEVKMKRVMGWLQEGYRVQLVVKHRTEELEAAAEALAYLTTRLQAEFKVEVGAQQAQRRALSALVKPLKQ